MEAATEDHLRERERRHHETSSRSSKPRTPVESESRTSYQRHRTKKEKEHNREKKAPSISDLVPEISRTSIPSSRVSLPHTSFSKVHSKQAVHSHSQEDVGTPTLANKYPLTPEVADLGSKNRGRSNPADGLGSRKQSAQKDDHRPPSPPGTDVSDEKKRRSKTPTPRLRKEHGSGLERPRSTATGLSRSSSRRDEESQLSTKIKTPSRATFIKSPTLKQPPGAQIVDNNGRSSILSGTKTSVAPKRKASAKDPKLLSPIETDDSPVYVQNIQEVPRVDYLLQNGGLAHTVSKHFLSAIPRQSGTRLSNPPLAGCETLFAPLFNILDQYHSVIHKQGSVAVATGHESGTRRLLDRLEEVFSRDLPAEGCSCIMCEIAPEEHRGLGWGEILEHVSGKVELPSWPPFDLASLGATATKNTADIPPRPRSPIKLVPDIAEEFRDHYLQQWKKVRSAVDTWTNNCTESPAPSPSHVDDEILTFAIHTNLDQEERPYFNALLSGTRELQSAFRAPTPLRKPRTDFIMMTGLQLQRLYRLSQTPRDAETAVYRVKHPLYHDILTTMMDIRPQEWEFLISGWCDGFLCPGADRDDAMTITADNPLSRGSLPGHGFFPPPPSREPMDPGMPRAPGFGASRSSKPYSQINSCGATPASFISLYSSSSTSPGHNQPPVSHDEEIEMVALAGIEQGIYQGMEALEDAFEKLHERAEMVRHALRQRNKGLLMSKQRRRLGKIDMLPQLSDTSAGNERPSWATGDDYKVMSESDWDEDDFDIAPEDSASNIPSSKYRRPKRQNQKNIPATIKEDDNEN